MLRDVNAVLEDGKLGVPGATGTGTHVKIGISDITVSVPLLITGRMKPKKIKEKLGLSPLADAAIDAVENGADKIYCIPVAATTEGTISEVNHTGTGEGTVSITGKPGNSFDVIIKITSDGGLNEAAFMVSTTGGYSYEEETTIPVNGEYVVADTGLKLKFAIPAEGAGKFKAGDIYQFSTTAPTVANDKILEAVGKLYNFNIAYEFIHIVGTSGKALWASLAQVAKEFMTDYKKPIFFLCESRYKNADETIDEYAQSLVDEANGINSYYIQVCAAYSKYTRMDGRTQIINNAGIVSGLYGLAKESTSIGKTSEYAISSAKMETLVPEGIEDFISALDDAKYLTFRNYVGLSGYYVNNARMMCPDGSDYRYAELIRVANRLIRDVSTAAFENLQIDIDAENPETDLAQLVEDLSTPVERMVEEKNISSGAVSINTEGLNILADEQVNVEITFVPRGYVREINLNFAMRNPYIN